ncbi:FAD-dependent monooxygenase [Streptomyces sp. NPDC059479]|uniref:FAD-dependent monooxygenase n=1 Tax=Streptomyces sp. NPDC059479 TaxID=3346848 RepID=UPI0036C9B7D7
MGSPFEESEVAADVLVVGAGPAGLVLTLELARRGVRVRLVEKGPGTFPGSRAKGVQPRTLEVFDDLGVVAAAQAAGGPYPPMGLHLGPLPLSWVMQKPAAPDPGTPYPDILLLPQYASTAILRRAVEDAGVDIAFNTEVTAVTQDAASAVAELADGTQARVRYVVGADGASSVVRKAAGLAFAGSTDEADRMIVADGRVEGLSRDRWHVFPRLGGRTVAACPLPGGPDFQLMIKLRPDDPVDLSQPALAELFGRLVGRGIRLAEVTWASVFRPNVRLASGYRQGRLLIAGDAAHVHTPAGAQGLNTGVQDAYNLGWKLAQVLAGAPERLLDTYEGERRPVAMAVLGRSSQLYAGAKKGRPGALRRGPDERQLSLTYAGGPLVSGSALAARTATLQAGDRAPDATLEEGRLFDLLRGPHFTLLAFGERAGAALDKVSWPEGGASLHRHLLSPPAGDSALRVTYGITRDTLILVRPDGYIAHVALAAASGDSQEPGRTDEFDLTGLARTAALMTPPLS